MLKKYLINRLKRKAVPGHGEKEKLQLEEDAIKLFLKFYNSQTDDKLEKKKHQDRPDFILFNPVTGKDIGVEVSHVFYDDEEAKMLLGRPYTLTHGKIDLSELSFVLNTRLLDKSQDAQDYPYNEEMMLIIRIASPIFNKESFNLLDDKIIIPQNRFSQIWLVFEDGIQRINY